ncbi:hypothetical protein Q3A68_21775 [Mucilaginibacter sp. BT774]|nr:hypothetical protein [Mucilaginibacter sp. BT774]
MLLIIDYAIAFIVFLRLLPIEKYTITLELTRSFETINVAMMTAGIFLIRKNVTV